MMIPTRYRPVAIASPRVSEAAKHSPQIGDAVFTAELKRADLLPPSALRLKPRQIGTPDLF